MKLQQPWHVQIGANSSEKTSREIRNIYPAQWSDASFLFGRKEAFILRHFFVPASDQLLKSLEEIS